MSKKIDRATYGPSWTEVVFGALLSAILGAVLGAALLVLRPVIPVKELPKEAERVRGAVYYIEGSRDSTKARQVLAKRTAFAGGQSVTVVEDEVNALAGAAPAAAKAKVPDQGKKAEKGKEEASGGMIAVGAPDFRIRDGSMQVAVPVTINALDLGLQMVAQARGGFARKGEVFVYEPAELYLGSCPVQRLPLVASYVRDMFIASQQIPEDLKAAWPKLTNVAIEGSALKLTMP